MKSLIYIPEKINVGYNKRSDTYTGKLAYIIYFDEKGKLRKETSWNNWRDKELGNDIFDNAPTEGFVLNKKVGDYSGYWGNHRSAYVRVYDSIRNFEFEITVENLLYILENATSTKGKGLEGEFVYGWSGKDLVLLPVDSPDYKSIQEYTNLLDANFKLGAKTIKVGATYLSKDGSEYVYLGKFPYYKYNYENKHIRKNNEKDYIYEKHKIKHYFFARLRDLNKYDDLYGGLEITTSLAKFIAVKDEECHENYAEFYEEMEKSRNFSPPNYASEEYIEYTLDEIKSLEKHFEENKYASIYFTDMNLWQEVRLEIENWREQYKGMYSVKFYREEYDSWRNRTNKREIRAYYDTLEEVFNNHKPGYGKIYLENGKLYEEEKIKYV